MVNAICTEIFMRRQYINDEIHTVYFGGGTPSLLSIHLLQMIVEQIKNVMSISPDAEITLEANPDDITKEKADAWFHAGINRFSIGVQSFYDDDLTWMNRAHHAQQAIQSIQDIQAAGIHNITIDLIYGTPTLSDDHWKKNVEQAIALNIPHLSCYALTVEPKTALHKMILQKKLPAIDQEKQSRHFEMLVQWMQAAGYEHYEISNFAKPGFRSRHNSSYWQGAHYLGAGPSAHSYNGYSRQWNIANNSLYINSIQKKILPFEIEELTATQQLNEYIMTSLRTIEGLSLLHIQNNWNAAVQGILEESAKYIAKGFMHHSNDTLLLTPQGKLFADGIAADLFQ